MDNQDTVYYRIPAIPDTTDPLCRIAAFTDVVEGVTRAFQHMLHLVARMPVGCAAVALLFAFLPADNAGALQQRLRLHAAFWAEDRNTRKVLAALFENGPLVQFYGPEPCDPPDICWPRYACSCDVVRRELAIMPSCAPAENWKIPPLLYEPTVFKADERCDYLSLDRVLDGIDEPVLIHLCVEPTDATSERMAVTRYCSHLQEVNKTWRSELLHDDISYFDETPRSSYRTKRPLRLPQTEDPIVDTVLRSVQDFRVNLHDLQLLFHYRVLAASPHVGRLVATTAADCAFGNGAYDLVVAEAGMPSLDEHIASCRRNRVSIPTTTGAGLREHEPLLYANFGRLANIAALKELAGAIRFPIGSYGSPRCIRQRTGPPLVAHGEMIVLGNDVGTNSSSRTSTQQGAARGIHKDDLRKGLAIFGIPGTGKTTAYINLCLELYRDKIPFVFLAPIAGEQSAIKRLLNHPDPDVRGLARDLQIYTPGRDDISRLTMNPLLLRTTLDQHIAGLMECFKGAIPFFPALEGVLQEALYLLYEEHPEVDSPPVMSDLVAVAQRVVDEKGYQGEVLSNLRAAIDVRLGSLCRGAIGRVFESNETCPTIRELTHGPCIIELDALTEEEIAIFVHFFLKSVREVLSPEPITPEYLRLAMLIDEGHLIAGADSEGSQAHEMANPKAVASHAVCRALAEFRKRKVCLAIGDQSPSNVAPDVVRLTGSKLAYQTLDEADRRTLGGAMLFSDFEVEHVARLLPGQAFFITNGYQRPRLIQTVNLHSRMDLADTPTPAELHALVASQPWYLDVRERIETTRLQRLVSAFEVFERRLAKAAKEAAVLRAAHFERKAEKKDVADVLGQIERVKASLQKQARHFEFDSFTGLLGVDQPTDPDDLVRIRHTLRTQFEVELKPKVEACIQMLSELQKTT